MGTTWLPWLGCLWKYFLLDVATLVELTTDRSLRMKSRVTTGDGDASPISSGSPAGRDGAPLGGRRGERNTRQLDRKKRTENLTP